MSRLESGPPTRNNDKHRLTERETGHELSSERKVERKKASEREKKRKKETGVASTAVCMLYLACHVRISQATQDMEAIARQWKIPAREGFTK